MKPFKSFQILLFLLVLVFTSNGRGVKNASQFSCHCNCGETSKVLISMMRSLLSTCTGKKQPETTKCPNAKNCEDLFKCGVKKSGVYQVDPDGKGKFKVYCDQTTTGGGWTVFQRRKDGSVNFYRGWNDYKTGFGNLKGEYWLGLEKIHRLTQQTQNLLRVEVADAKGRTAYAEYNRFVVSSERDKYRLSIGTYSGTAGDSLSFHDNMAFSTKGSDNDKWSKGNCAMAYQAAWWYKDCHYSNLNGQYKYHGTISTHGVTWYKWKGSHYSLAKAEMKMRPVNKK